MDRLSLELQLLKSEDRGTLVPILIAINDLFKDEGLGDSLCRNLNFMSYEISVLGSDLNEGERWSILNEYFFSKKSFQLKKGLCDPLHADDLLLKVVLNHRLGHPLLLSLIYCHLAAQLDLPVFMINLHHPHFLKWVRSDHNSYINLKNRGELMNERELTFLINQKINSPLLGNESKSLEILPPRQIIIEYLNLLVDQYRATEDPESLLILYELLVNLDSTNLVTLARRSMLYRELGRVKEAIADLKRYFSFVDRSHAAPELQIAFLELQREVETNPLISIRGSLY